MKSEVTYNLEYLLMCTDQNLNNFGVFRTTKKKSEKWLTVLLETYSKISIYSTAERLAHPCLMLFNSQQLRHGITLDVGFSPEKKVKL